MTAPELTPDEAIKVAAFGLDKPAPWQSTPVSGDDNSETPF